MKIKLDKDLCIGCGQCISICDDVFDWDEDGLAKTKKENIKEEYREEATEAINSCPVDAISEIEE